MKKLFFIILLVGTILKAGKENTDPLVIHEQNVLDLITFPYSSEMNVNALYSDNPSDDSHNNNAGNQVEQITLHDLDMYAVFLAASPAICTLF